MSGDFGHLRERIARALWEFAYSDDFPEPFPDEGEEREVAMQSADAVLDALRPAVEAVAGPLLDHWAECPLPPDAGCEECAAWWAARRVLVPRAEHFGSKEQDR